MCNATTSLSGGCLSHSLLCTQKWLIFYCLNILRDSRSFLPYIVDTAERCRNAQLLMELKSGQTKLSDAEMLSHFPNKTLLEESLALSYDILHIVCLVNYSGVQWKWEFVIKMRTACFAPSFLKNRSTGVRMAASRKLSFKWKILTL